MNNRFEHYDYLIVGTGLYGATFAYRARRAGKRCLAIDKRPHTGGNLHCRRHEGINVHCYGAHIFHTSNEEVWNLVNSIVRFNRYTNSPIACYKGQLYNLPFNMNTFCRMWGGVTTPDEARRKIDEQRAEFMDEMNRAGITEPRNLEEQAIALVGKDIYHTLIEGYTEKQWGRKCSELPAFIIKRLPIRFVFDNNYFNDTFQGIPVGGYNLLIDGLLGDTETITDADFFADRQHWESLADKIVFTGRIDEFYDFRFGKLEYRTVRFEEETLPVANYQGNAVVNYTDAAVPYTRIIEHKHFEMFGEAVYDTPSTVISREYSAEWRDGSEPFYPINDRHNTALYEKYKRLADAETDVIFGGRLAEYKYYDMAPIIEAVLKLEI